MISKLRPTGQRKTSICLYSALVALFLPLTPMMRNFIFHWHQQWGTSPATYTNEGELVLPLTPTMRKTIPATYTNDGELFILLIPTMSNYSFYWYQSGHKVSKVANFRGEEIMVTMAAAPWVMTLRIDLLWVIPCPFSPLKPWPDRSSLRLVKETHLSFKYLVLVLERGWE